LEVTAEIFEPKEKEVARAFRNLRQSGIRNLILEIVLEEFK
jgi:hypothetical protein